MKDSAKDAENQSNNTWTQHPRSGFSVPPQPPLIRLYRPSDLANYTPPPTYNLVGDHHIARGGITILAGPPGVGKSRLGTLLAVAGAGPVEWCGYPVNHQFKSLILQSQNGLPRLKTEYDDFGPSIEDYILVSEPPERGLRFFEPEFRAELKGYLQKFKPGLIQLDTWGDIAHGDKQVDFDNALGFIRMVIPQRDYSPAVLIIAHTRKKPDPRYRRHGRALMEDVLGSIYFPAFARCVFVVQPVSDDLNNHEFVLTCTKNNDGTEGKPSAWEWVPQSSQCRSIKGFDWAKWYSEGKGNPGDWKNVAAILTGLGSQGTRSDLAKALETAYGIDRSTAYRWITMAAKRKAILSSSRTPDFFTVNPHWYP